MGNNSFSKYIEKVTGSVAAFDMSQMMAMFAGSGNSSNGTGGFDWASMFGGNGTGFHGMGGNGTGYPGMGGNGTGFHGMGGNGSGNDTNGSFDMSSMMSMFGMGAAPNSFAYVFDVGVYNITVKALSSRNYEAVVNDTAKLNVVVGDKANINRLATTLEYQDMTTVTVNEKIDGKIGKDFVVLVKDGNGNPLINKSVQIGFNGKVYDLTTDDKGYVKLQST